MHIEQEFLWRAFAATGDPLAYLDYRRGSDETEKIRRKDENKKSIG